jgi:hypothetical protein
MKTILRFLIVLAVALTLGFAAYAFIPPLNPSQSLTQTAYSGAYHGGHPQGGPGGAGGAAITFVTAVGKFLMLFAGVALAKFGLGKIVSRRRKTALGAS